MALNFKKYSNLLKRLLPKGRAWEQVKKHLLFDGMAKEYCRIEDEATRLLNVEMDPRTADELLTDWEQLLGLPDECTPENQTIPERRIQAAQKLGSLGGLSKPYYEDLAALLGYNITVEDAFPFRVGQSRVGKALYNNSIRDTFRVGQNRVGDQLRVFGWQYYWIARIPISETKKFRVGQSTVGERLVDYSNELLECTLRKHKPAHTGVVFLFDETA